VAYAFNFNHLLHPLCTIKNLIGRCCTRQQAARDSWPASLFCVAPPCAPRGVPRRVIQSRIRIKNKLCPKSPCVLYVSYALLITWLGELPLNSNNQPEGREQAK